MTWLQGFPDRESIAPDHQPSVANAYRLQIVAGQSDGRYYPLAEVTRAQSVGMLYEASLQDAPAAGDATRARPDLSRLCGRECGKSGSARALDRATAV